MKQEKRNENLFCCNDCGKTFISALSLKLHSYKHMANRPHKCQHCSKSYGRSAHLRRHIKSVHGNDQSNYTIKSNISHDECVPTFNGAYESDDDMEVELVFDSDGSLKEDSYINSKQSDNETPSKKSSFEPSNYKLYNCKYCVESFCQPSLLKEHMDTHPNSRPYECVNCDKGYMSASALYKHKKGKHGKKQNSTFIKTKTKSNKTYNSNTIEYKKQKNFLANKSNDEVKIEKLLKSNNDFSEQIQYDLQLKSNEIESKKMAKCEICEKMFNSRSAMLQHANIHNKSRIRVCLQCNRTFTNYVRFLRHKSSHIRKLHQCSYCPKTYSKKIYLVKHMSTHSWPNISNYTEVLQCKLCALNFPKLKDFENHLKSEHTINQPIENSFICKHCNLLFHKFNHFAHHFVTQHTKPRSVSKLYKCEYCEKSYSKKKYLEKHMRTHSNDVNNTLIGEGEYEEDNGIGMEEDILNGGDYANVVSQDLYSNQLDFCADQQNYFDNQTDFYGGIAFIPN